ncbi:MAG: hypothetical protein ACFCVD_12495 [Nodosilinea sp.]
MLEKSVDFEPDRCHFPSGSFKFRPQNLMASHLFANQSQRSRLPMTTPPDSNPTKVSPLQEKADQKAVDPRDLVTKSGLPKTPQELIENPAVTPQMIDESDRRDTNYVRDDRDETGMQE